MRGRPLRRTPTLFRAPQLWVAPVRRLTMDATTESTFTTTTTSDIVSQLTQPLLDSDFDVRTLATPTREVPPSGPPVSLKPCLCSRSSSPYDKRKRHPSNETDSAKPCAKLRPNPSITLAYPRLGASPVIRSPPSDMVTSAFISLDSHETLPVMSHITPISTHRPLTPPKKRVTFTVTFNDLRSLSLQPADIPSDQPDTQPEEPLPWAQVPEHEIDDTLNDNHDFGATNVTAWNLIKDQLILSEKCRGRATLAHNARLGNSLPDWSLGITKIPSLMLPVSHREAFFDMIKQQAIEKLNFMQRVLTTEADLCDRVAKIHTETMTRCLDTAEDQRMFPLLRDRTAKLAHSRAAAYGKRIFEKFDKNPATEDELEDALIEPLPNNEFHCVKPRNRSRSPVRNNNYRPRSRSPRPRPSGPRGPTNGPRPRAPASVNNRGGHPRGSNYNQSSQGRSYTQRPRNNASNRRPPHTADRATQQQAQLSPGELASLRALIQNGRQ